MNYEQTLGTLVEMHENIMNKYGYCKNAIALEKAISLLQFIIQNDK